MKYFQIYRLNLTWELLKTEILRQDFGVFRFVSGVLSTFYTIVYTLRHVTAKFAHMNGHWKAYNTRNCVVV